MKEDPEEFSLQNVCRSADGSERPLDNQVSDLRTVAASYLAAACRGVGMVVHLPSVKLSSETPG